MPPGTIAKTASVAHEESVRLGSAGPHLDRAQSSAQLFCNKVWLDSPCQAVDAAAKTIQQLQCAGVPDELRITPSACLRRGS